MKEAQLLKLLNELYEYLRIIEDRVRVGSDFSCPDCGATEFHHKFCTLREFRDRVADAAEEITNPTVDEDEE